MDELNHHGVPGMKWGVRRKKDSTTSSAKRMTNEQLSASIRRMELERRYSSLTAPEKSKASKLVSEIIGNAAKQTATEFVKRQMVNGVDDVAKYLVKKRMS